MEKIEVDCNFNYLGPDCPSVSAQEARLYELVVGEEVVIYQDDDKWGGRVFFDPALPYQYQWHIRILRDYECLLTAAVPEE
ncbi:MAG: hypothetical protein LBU11_00420 [Zoogloeaceae bacterium]|jgi:hypothetical protein|nr:hypothetical protein [Zoogloeaceae bacterium]